MSAVFFAMWFCHCTILAAAADDIPASCPTHAVGLLPGVAGSRDLVIDPAPTTVLGYHSEVSCQCPAHRTDLPLFEVTA